MENVITTTAAHFNGNIINATAVKFEKYDSEFCITDGRIYTMVDGCFCSAGKAVKSLSQVIKFVEARK